MNSVTPRAAAHGSRISEAGSLTSKSDLSSTTKCDQNNIFRTYKFGHT
jgi:hypothetical protein